jgi:hypothetical protein
MLYSIDAHTDVVLGSSFLLMVVWNINCTINLASYQNACNKTDFSSKTSAICFTSPLNSSFPVRQQPNPSLGRLIVDVSRSHTIRHTRTPGRTALNERSARRRGRYIHNRQQTLETSIYALSVIRTRNPNTRVAAQLRLRPHGLRDRRLNWI